MDRPMVMGVLVATKKIIHACSKVHKNRKHVNWIRVGLTIYMTMSTALQFFLLYMVITQQDLIDKLACNVLSLAQSITQLIGQ